MLELDKSAGVKAVNELDILRVIERFNETGAKLEARYQTLLQETETLRTALREKDLEVKRAEKLALLGETAAAIAHEVRNPLGSIKLFLSLLRREVENSLPAGRLVDQIDRSIVGLDNVVSNILQFAKSNDLTGAPVNTHALIRELAEYFGELGAGRSTLTLELKGNPYILGNDAALRQIFHNVLLNAHQATKYSGAVTVTGAEAPDESIEICVRDNGPGIPEAVVGRLFEPFVTSKSEGTGLGLAITRQLVSAHGGSIEASNDGGAVFRIVFPRRGIKAMQR